MLLLSVLQGLLEIAAGLLTQAKLGMVGLVLLFGLGVGIRARHNGLAVGAAVVLMLLMTQA
ncbi:hypothetical protein JCM4814A_76550 [Streptomyces phaeofaciens JCM 4814]|uniref:Uncharacterized protein n=1 Tax=Streptomyces phaeofaciens TaxID=68254 RepID=A0A918HNM8_9ACTN|nr:hypothetical protein [Streptomyces phaeofaciens]GGT85555.1 hypothetical protein GCM10010226_75180 [Streptomyces phaeofaciens]